MRVADAQRLRIRRLRVDLRETSDDSGSPSVLRILAPVLGLVGLLLLPLVIGEFVAYQLALYFVYAIAALGVGLCWGRAGFLPLGQALFFGLSAYLSGLILLRYGESPWVLYPLLGAAAIAPGALAYVLGRLVFRRRGESGPYFSMITLALSLLGFQVANNWDALTGGFNGLKGIPALPGLEDYVDSYRVAAVALVVSCTTLAWLYRAPLGVSLAALADNERRLAMFGFDTNRLKAVAFGISGMLAGVGGTLYAPQQGLVTPQLCGFVLSADLVIWAAIGGRSRLLGPVLGAVAVGVLTSELRSRFGWWEIAVAAIFIVVVLMFPQGIAGIFEPLRRRWAGRPVEPSEARRSAPGDLLGEADEARAIGGASLSIEGVSAGFGRVQILDSLSLAIDRPGVYCVIGPNGAGKTSTFNMLTGEMPVWQGRVLLDGRPITGRPMHVVARERIGRKFQIPSVFNGLSIADNLAIAQWSDPRRAVPWLSAATRDARTWTIRSLVERFAFLEDQTRKAAELSLGERQMLELAMALVGEPRLLLLDEPCAGLSPSETAQVVETIRWASQRFGLTVVVIEHDMALVRRLADHVFVLHQGALLAQGTLAAVQRDPAVQAVYVGAEK